MYEDPEEEEQRFEGAIRKKRPRYKSNRIPKDKERYETKNRRL